MGDNLFELFSDENADVSNFVYQIGNSTEKRAKMGDHRYAPNEVGSLYVLLSGLNRDALIHTMDDKPRYISVELLIQMENDIDWTKLDANNVADEGRIKRERKFIKDKAWKNMMFYPKPKPKKKGAKKPPDGPTRKRGECKIPVVDQYGNFEMLLASNQSIVGGGPWYQAYMTMWNKTANNLLTLPPSGGNAVKPPRTAKVPLQHGLMVVINETAHERFGDATTAQTIFENCVNKINAKPSGPYSLKIISRADSASLIPTSINPFGLYHGFVHEDDWHAYMTSLTSGSNPPIRPFPTLASDGSLMNKVNVVIDNRNAVRSELIERAVDNAKSTDEGLKWPDSVWTAVKRLDAKVEHMENLPGYSTSKWIELSAKKIKNAAGTRIMEDTQKQVMGVSAPDLAISLGWSWKPDNAPNKNQMKNYLYIAEWLHLSAYSFGGFLGQATNQGSTSQMSENLVLGTSETNSLMTRYEYAWQNLIKDEMTLQNREDWEPEGLLAIDTNMPEDPVYYDCVKDGKFGVGFVDALGANMQINQGPSPPYSPVDLGVLRHIATQFKFIAYSMKWKAGYLDYSYILNMNNPTFSTIFSPFMRPFFHVLEEALDSELYTKMKEMAQAQANQGV